MTRIVPEMMGCMERVQKRNTYCLRNELVTWLLASKTIKFFDILQLRL